ncbi:hypothetical protein KB20921_31920 [Edwardsiella ictaluri]|nr:hypothetical protein KH20906_31820 [Edwardsiella ictaluri]BEI03931.1 hypothetical protein KB20921_31920 [Edwardsiella ictaluri]BEI07387.1 hypothetical protein KH201010_31730 [Edwardsiella ictaluri]BEI10859.1 hypothetical protein STU22726_31900 [Edwardsiella ictaluri]BEI14338.1 hypothetical protein STU22816_31910 [Edwardsiella ictaluri]
MLVIYSAGRIPLQSRTDADANPQWPFLETSPLQAGNASGKLESLCPLAYYPRSRNMAAPQQAHP